MPQGEGSGFESGEGLSIPWVHLSSLGGDPDEDTFFRHTFLVVGFASISSLIPRISYVGFSASRSCGCEA